MFANDFAKTTPNAIPHNGRTKRSRSYKAGAESIAGYRKHTQNKKFSALSASALFYLIELFRLG
jgi:hypothetical protein